MPEGPEVETIRLGLLDVVGQTILNVHTSGHPKFSDARIFELKGREIKDIQRRGKFIIWYIGEWAVLNHLGMTGIWNYLSPKQWKGLQNIEEEYPHYKVHFKLSDNSHLLYINTRTFGKFEIITPEEVEKYPAIAKLGPDILDPNFDMNEFIKRVKGSKTRPRTKAITKCLLDYSIVAGCGNIYRAEALYLAGISPFTPAYKLSKHKIRKLGAALQEVARTAMKFKGSTLRDFKHVDGYGGLMQNQFQVYGKAGEKCTQCNTPILKERLDNRSIFYCPNCQH